MKKDFSGQFAILLATALMFLGSEPVRATNQVYNGSFELFEAGWRFSGGLDLRVNMPSAAGTNHVGIINTLWQDVPTQLGETYYVRFSAKYADYVPTVYFGGQAVAMSAPPTNVIGPNWFFVEGYAPATGSVTRIEFVGSTYVDDVRIIATHEPVQIIHQPESRSAIEGGTVSFSVVADGGPPLFYFWQWNNAPISGATNAILILSNLNLTAAGTYSAIVSNVAGSLTSTDATLTVEAAPEAPLIVFQPGGDTCPAGYAYYLSVVALGTAPLQYQWFQDGAEIPDATNRVLTFASIQSSSADTYTVRVENQIGSVLSLPALVTVINASGGGSVNFQNWAAGSRQPIYDIDGVTKLSGTNYYAQLYAGSVPTILRALGSPRPFMTGPLAGYFQGSIVTIPDVLPNELVYVQTRVWEGATGICYEDARARGGKYGSSPIFSMVSVLSPPAIPPVVPMVSFNLRAGLPLFTTGKLEINARPPGQPIEWKLTGASGSRYLIEKRTPPQNWTPLFVLTNTTGTVLFTDTNGISSPVNFYRSRMLD